MTGVGIVDANVTSPEVDTLTAQVSSMLWVWDSVRLEIGEVAVVTDGHPWSRLAALAATWYGALPVLFVSSSPGKVPAGVTAIRSTGSEQEARDLAAMVKGAPGAAAAELSGTAAMVDLLLEALPPGARIVLAGGARERLTIDYYLNVHIKGRRLVSGILDAAGVEARDPGRVERARRLLDRSGVAAACRDALAAR
jgi:hypothetical protein